MTFETNGTMLIDEIERLFVAYDKGKEYLSSIFSRIDQQVDLWQKRRAIILDQQSSSASMDFLLSKTQRINELTIEAVQNLCRVDILIEQIIRIDPKIPTKAHPISTSFSTRPIAAAKSLTSTNSIRPQSRSPFPTASDGTDHSVEAQMYTDSALRIPSASTVVPVLRKATQRQTSSGSASATPASEKAMFQPIEQQYASSRVETTSKPTVVLPRPSPYATSEESTTLRSISHPYRTQTPQSDPRNSPATTTFTTQKAPRSQSSSNEKVEVKLERIPPGTRWRQARIDIIDSLSAFYVENLDRKVHDKRVQMSDALDKHYENLERSNKLSPLQNIAIGDFGVARFSEDNRWYRARLLAFEDNNQINIVFIDFGNMETKTIDDFYPLDRSFADLSAQAIACTLSEAYPRTTNQQEEFWPKETIDIFRSEVVGKLVEIVFGELEQETDRWPLPFVKILVNGQSVTNLPTLKPCIEFKPNHFIADQLAPSMSVQELILFNVAPSET